VDQALPCPWLISPCWPVLPARALPCATHGPRAPLKPGGTWLRHHAPAQERAPAWAPQAEAVRLPEPHGAWPGVQLLCLIRPLRM